MSDDPPITLEELESRRLLATIRQESVNDNVNSADATNVNDNVTQLQLTENPNPLQSPAQLTQEPRPLALLPTRPADRGPAFGLDNLVELWYCIAPDMPLYDWQAEELYRMSGYISGRPVGPKVDFTAAVPFLGNYPCANGSGKDEVFIATVAIGNILFNHDANTVATSASHEQLKFQTETRIKRAIANLNKRFGLTIFDSVEFHHRCPARGGEIKLFATDEAGRAEGWHPLVPGGKFVIIINEAKTINADLFSALDRCHGYTSWLEISSPGAPFGLFYENFRRAVHYPDPPVLGRYYSRQISYKQCPHIPDSAFDRTVEKHGINSFIVQTSFLANFYANELDVIIPLSSVRNCADVKFVDGSIGIGLDAAAGGDETVLVVRRGNKPIDLLAFREKDTTLAADRIDNRLDPYRYLDYTFDADDGGVGRSFLDNLTAKGWRINRRHSQSAAYQKQEYSNLGAEFYGHCRDLFAKREIIPPTDETTLRQLTTRQGNIQEGLGRLKISSKKRIKEIGGASPDRGDAFVLAFYSYKPRPVTRPDQTPPTSEDSYTPAELSRLLRYGNLQPRTSAPAGRPTCLTI